MMTEFKDPFKEAEELFDNKHTNQQQVEYIGFGDRVLALILDGIFVGVPVAILNFWNLYELRSFFLFLGVTLLAICYKPILELKYGATFGKMIVNIKVLNENGDRISNKAAWLRSVFTIGQSLLQLPFYYLAYNNSELLELKGFAFNTAIAMQYPMINIISIIGVLILIVEVIVLVTDDVRHQSLHDKIAKTIVVRK